MYCIDDFSCKKSRLLFVCISCSNHFIKPCLQTTVSQSSLFEHLINIWEFNPGPVPGTCDLYFHVDFKFQSPLYRQVFLWHLMCGYGLWFFFYIWSLSQWARPFFFISIYFSPTSSPKHLNWHRWHWCSLKRWFLDLLVHSLIAAVEFMVQELPSLKIDVDNGGL